jgi:ribosomal protein bL25 (Ctc-form)
MAGEIPDLIAVARTGTGKGAARQARRDGMVPGIVYGGGKDPLAIQIPFNVLLKRLKQGRFLSTLFNLKVDGQEDVRVICRGVQRDVIKDLPTHVDLMRLRRTTRVALFIPVEFINHEKSPGLKRGGVLTVVRAEVTSVWSPAHTFAGDLVLSVRSPGSAPTFFIYRDSVGGSDDYFGETTVLTTTTIIGRSGNGPWEWRAFDDAIIDTGTIQSVTLRVWCR